MPIVVEDVIREAIDLSIPYVDGNTAPLGSLVRLLQTMEEELLAYYSSSEPERLSLASPYPVKVKVSSNSAGYPLAAPPPLPSGTSVVVDAFGDPVFGSSDTVMLTDGPTQFAAPMAISFSEFVLHQPNRDPIPLLVVSELVEDFPPRHPAVFLRGNRLFPCDPEGKRWSTSGVREYFKDGDIITFRYIPRSLPYKLGSTMLLPDEARTYLVSRLALFLLLSADRVPDTRIQKAIADVSIAERTVYSMGERRIRRSYYGADS